MARWLCLGIFFFLSIPSLVFYERSSFNQKEPFYSSPIPAPGGVLSIRSDIFGKGYFGASRNNKRTHAGLDLTQAVGGPVTASKSGRVGFAGEDKGYGYYVELRHPDGLSTRYAHLSQIRVREGEWIPQGQTIGLSGKSGNADNPRIIPHLHFEIRYKKFPLDPGNGLLDPQLRLNQKGVKP